MIYLGVRPTATDPSPTAGHLGLGLALIPTRTILALRAPGLTVIAAPTGPTPPLPAPITADPGAGGSAAEDPGEDWVSMQDNISMMMRSRFNGETGVWLLFHAHYEHTLA